MAFTVILIFINAFVVDNIWIGQKIKRATYDALQGRLGSGFDKQKFPVVIVDIGSLTRKEEDKGEPVTPRETLLDLVKLLAEKQPAAIGIDIDFSPDHGVYAPGDLLFFKACDLLRRSKKDAGGAVKNRGTPIFLGVGRTVAEDPDRWLPEAPAGLAAALVKPRDISRMTAWIDKEEPAHVTAAQPSASALSQPNLSLSMALAEAQGLSQFPEKWYIRALEKRLHIIEQIGSRSFDLAGEHYSLHAFPVDFSPVDYLSSRRNEALLVLERDDLENSKTLEDRFAREDWLGQIYRKVVLIGNATSGSAVDYFNVPDREEPVPGVFVQASAVYTLTDAPLYEFKCWARLLADFLVSFLIFFALMLARQHYAGQGLNVDRVRIAAIAVAIVGIVGSALLVRITHVLWDDFLLVIAALLVHSPVERRTHKAWVSARVAVPHLLRRIFFEPPRANG